MSSRKLSLGQCQPLIENILGRITAWTVKFLSYAGRLQLVNSVLTSIQAFWTKIFLLPKQLLKIVETICKRFYRIERHKLKERHLFHGHTLLAKSSRRNECYRYINVKRSSYNKALVGSKQEER